LVNFKTEEECELDLPSAYTPNGDGFNDGYEIKGIERFPDNRFRVFNRWGNEVYNKEDYTNTDWVGQNNDGSQLPEGTYFVILEITGRDIKKHTYVDLRRYAK
jgi:gliding motility-associated-like protein